MLSPLSKRAEQITYLVFVTLVLVLFAAEVARDFEPVKLGALFCVLMWVPLLLVHEAGHALVARWFGCHVEHISLGFGRSLGSFQLGATTVAVRAIPIEGFVRFSSRGLSRWKNALIYFAGPATELLVGAIVLLWVGPDRLLSASDDIPIIAAQSLCVCAVMSAVANLIPHMGHASLDDRSHGRRSSPNDGMGILLSLFGRASAVAKRLSRS